VNEILDFSCWKTSFSLWFFSTRSPVLRRTLTRGSDEDDGACGGVGSTLISDCCEECQDELLVPMFLKALPAFFTFLNILQTKIDTNTTSRKCEMSAVRNISSLGISRQDKFLFWQHLPLNNFLLWTAGSLLTR